MSQEGGFREKLHPITKERKMVPENSLFLIFFFYEKANTLPAPTSHVVIQPGAEQHKQLNQYWRSAAALGTNA